MSFWQQWTRWNSRPSHFWSWLFNDPDFLQSLTIPEHLSPSHQVPVARLAEFTFKIVFLGT
jgi:hypothetical protein